MKLASCHLFVRFSFIGALLNGRRHEGPRRAPAVSDTASNRKRRDDTGRR